MHVPKVRFGIGKGTWQKKLGLNPKNIHRKSVNNNHKVKTHSKPESPEAWLRKQIETFPEISRIRDNIEHGLPISDLDQLYYNEMMGGLLTEMPFHDPEIIKLFNL